MVGESRFLTYPKANIAEKRVLMSNNLNYSIQTHIEFILTPGGFKMINKNRKLTTDGERDDFNPLLSNQVTVDSQISQEHANALWTLIPVQDNKNNEPNFFIELSQGEIRPRLVRVRHQRYLRVTTKEQEGYSDPKFSVWKVFASGPN